MPARHDPDEEHNLLSGGPAPREPRQVEALREALREIEAPTAQLDRLPLL